MKQHRRVTYIIQGILEKAKEKDMRLKVVSGGMRSLRYCNIELGHLKQKVTTRKRKYVSFLRSYPNLYLGGTMAVWNQPELRRGWMLHNKECMLSELKSIEDFKPLIRYLLDSYDYVWIYAASAAYYEPIRQGKCRAL